MANSKATPKYSEDFKKTIVSLYQSGKTYSEIQKEYGVSVGKNLLGNSKGVRGFFICPLQMGS